MMMKGLIKGVLKGLLKLLLDILNVALIGLPKLNSKLALEPNNEKKHFWRLVINFALLGLPAVISALNRVLKRF